MIMRRFIPYILLSPLYIILIFYLYWALNSLLIHVEKLSNISIDNVLHQGIKYEVNKNDNVVVIHPGDIFTMSFVVERNKSCSVDITRILRDKTSGAEYNISSQTRIFKPESPHQIYNSVPVPYSIPPGKYEFFSKLNFECNPYEKLFPVYKETNKIPVQIQPSE